MMRQILFSAISIVMLSLLACGNASNEAVHETSVAVAAADVIDADETPIEVAGDSSNPGYIVISKEDMRLRLYDTQDLLICEFKVATGKNVGNKRKRGDMKTPEGEFTVQMIQPSADWTHNFGDGKGEIHGCYGPWFIRLKTPPHTGIGIHGTHLPESIGTRATEGCIRLNNSDLDSLKPMVRVGMKVIVESAYEDRVEDAKIDGLPLPERPLKEEDRVSPVEVSTKHIEPASKPVRAVWVPDEDGEIEPVKEVVEIAAPTEDARPVAEVVEEREAHAEAVSQTPQQPTPQHPTQQQPTLQQPRQQPKSEASQSSDAVYHTIAEGELVGAIAIKYGTTVGKIRELNPDLNPDRVSIGQVIRVR